MRGGGEGWPPRGPAFWSRPCVVLGLCPAVLLTGLVPAQGRHWLMGPGGHPRRSDTWGAPSQGPWHRPGVCTQTQASISQKFLLIGMGRGWLRAAHHPWPAEDTSPAQRPDVTIGRWGVVSGLPRPMARLRTGSTPPPACWGGGESLTQLPEELHPQGSVDEEQQHEEEAQVAHLWGQRWGWAGRAGWRRGAGRQAPGEGPAEGRVGTAVALCQALSPCLPPASRPPRGQAGPAQGTG